MKKRQEAPYADKVGLIIEILTKYSIPFLLVDGIEIEGHKSSAGIVFLDTAWNSDKRLVQADNDISK